MIKLHSVGLVNKDYSEAWLNKMSDRGYSLEDIKFYMLFIFRKRREEEEKEEYKLEVFNKDGMFSSMPSGDVKDFDTLSKNFGFERIKNIGQVGVFKVLDKEKYTPLYGVEEEKRVVKKIIKTLKIVLFMPFFLILLNGIFSIIDNIVENTWKINDIFYTLMVIFFIFLFIAQYVNIKAFEKLNKEMYKTPNTKLQYLNSKVRYQLENYIALISSFLAIATIISVIWHMTHSKNFIVFLVLVLITLFTSTAFSVFFTLKIKPSINLSDKRKKSIFIFGLLGIIVFNFILVLYIVLGYSI